MFDYVVIQAGGLGSRLKHLTRNKPKGIVPVENLPIVFHLFRKFPDKKFLIIADYKADVLESYLETFAEVEFFVVRATEKGTCAGIRQAIHYIPDGASFLLIWSDLILGEKTLLDVSDDENYLGISKDFECRWSYVDGKFIETPSVENGVAGLFVFKNRQQIDGVPASGEFVRWLSQKCIMWSPLGLYGTREVGTMLAYDATCRQNDKFQCRPFNSMVAEGNKLIKTPVDKYGKSIAHWEQAWYRKVKELGYTNIPSVFSFDPLCMECIDGQNIYDLSGDISFKKTVVDKIVDSLQSLHSLAKWDASVFDLIGTYFDKTFSRLSKIRDMVPFAERKVITINGRACHNPFYLKSLIRSEVKKTIMDANFCLIHGDCTFSNMMLDRNGNIILIDPRGYFGRTAYYGDPDYDWAKVYYSIAGNYDQFNRKHFTLDINDEDVLLSIESSGWEDVGDYFLSKIDVDTRKIKLLHVLIWLSLTTYAWEDYDSICGAFYNGCYLLEDFLKKEKFDDSIF